MITTVDGELQIACDDCGEVEYGGTAEFAAFAAFWRDKKREGWKTRKDPETGKWFHRCPGCTEGT